MKTRAVRMYGLDDLRLEEFELPEIKDDEILVKVMSDSICMSTYKLVKQGKKHKRAPQNIDTNPIIVGHEFAGDIVQVGKKWQDQFKPGQKFSIQPAINYQGKLDSPGYSYEFCGGAATYCIIPHEVMEMGCLLSYDGESYFQASLGEPMSCIIGGYHANYHTNKKNYEHAMGTKTDGNILIMGGCGPMGLGAVSYGIQFENKPKRIVVTDVNEDRINRAREVISEEHAKEMGVELHYVNTAGMADPIAELMAITQDHGYDDVFEPPCPGTGRCRPQGPCSRRCGDPAAGRTGEPQDHLECAGNEVPDILIKKSSLYPLRHCLRNATSPEGRGKTSKRVNAAIYGIALGSPFGGAVER